jgi:predicted HTH transcriptional regulator
LFNAHFKKHKIMSDITNLLESAQKEREAKKAKADKEYAKLEAEILIKVKSNLAATLTEALGIYETIPANVRNGILSDAAFLPILKSFGLKKAKTTQTKKASKPKVTDEAIVAYLSSERTTGEVKTHFDFSAVTVGKRLADLVKAGTVSMRKEHTSKFWKKV